MTISEAMEDYNDGNWQPSINKLQAVKAEADVYISWNLWKMQKKGEAASIWKEVIFGTVADDVTKASAYAGLGIYYAEMGNKEKALEYAQFAQNLLPENATANQNKNLNACGITMAKIGELDQAEKILSKVAYINQQLEKSDDPVIVREAKHQRAKNGYNLASLIYIPQKRFKEAVAELEARVIPRYIEVEAETDLAAAYHRISEVYENGTGVNYDLEQALHFEQLSFVLWQEHSDDPERAKTARKNVSRIQKKINFLSDDLF
jgi:tetratricopeptide (TPR) repeat protein